MGFEESETKALLAEVAPEKEPERPILPTRSTEDTHSQTHVRTHTNKTKHTGEGGREKDVSHTQNDEGKEWRTKVHHVSPGQPCWLRFWRLMERSSEGGPEFRGRSSPGHLQGGNTKNNKAAQTPKQKQEDNT